MHMTKHGITAITRIAAIVFLTASAVAGLSAQPQTQAKPLDLKTQLNAPLNLSAPPSLRSSSSAGVAETAEVVNSDLADGQSSPPPLAYQQHRRTNFSDGWHNADGSNKWAFSAGAGFTVPVGGARAYYKTSWDFQFGGGRNFNKDLGVMLNFNWANFGITDNILNRQLNIYNGLGAGFSSLGGYGHIWSFSVDPVYNMAQNETSAVYVTGGVGFYHKFTAFTIPSSAIFCDPFFGCYQVPANQPVDWYTSNAVGFNGGFGFTHRFSRFANERFYAEVRYVYTANSRRPFFDGTNGTPRPNNPNYFNVFPENSAPTSYIPITFGIRF